MMNLVVSTWLLYAPISPRIFREFSFASSEVLGFLRLALWPPIMLPEFCPPVSYSKFAPSRLLSPIPWLLGSSSGSCKTSIILRELSLDSSEVRGLEMLALWPRIWLEVSDMMYTECHYLQDEGLYVEFLGSPAVLLSMTASESEAGSQRHPFHGVKRGTITHDRITHLTNNRNWRSNLGLVKASVDGECPRDSTYYPEPVSHRSTGCLCAESRFRLPISQHRARKKKHIIVRVGIVGEVPPLTVVNTLERNGKLNILLVNR